MADAGTPLETLIGFARHHRLRITDTCGCGGHNPGSLHYQGRAIDVSVQGVTDAEVQAIITSAGGWGIHVIDERHRLPGEQVWTGPHLHLEVRA
jgi:hypothetical protein